MAEILTYPAEELAETVGAASALAVAH